MGTVSGIVGPIVGFIAWAALTFSYRRSKRCIVLEVVKRVRLEDISDHDLSLDTVPALNGHRAGCDVPSSPRAAVTPSFKRHFPGGTCYSVCSMYGPGVF